MSGFCTLCARSTCFTNRSFPAPGYFSYSAHISSNPLFTVNPFSSFPRYTKRISAGLGFLNSSCIAKLGKEWGNKLGPITAEETFLIARHNCKRAKHRYSCFFWVQLLLCPGWQALVCASCFCYCFFHPTLPEISCSSFYISSARIRT
jgi:hypothetical protein